jgi:hypothetical protein
MIYDEEEEEIHQENETNEESSTKRQIEQNTLDTLEQLTCGSGPLPASPQAPTLLPP